MHEQMKFKESLERMYDIPFVVDSGIIKFDPWYVITPYCEDKSLFSIRLTFRNALRLTMDFEPHKYSANLIRSMGMSSKEQRLAFNSYAQMLVDNGAKIDFAINDLASSISAEDWPDQWNKVRAHVTIMPIYHQEYLNDISYLTIAIDWGCLMIGMILSLLDIVPLDGSDEAIEGYEEGNKAEIMANKYERNPINRVICLRKYGYQCQVCGFDFSAIYGDIGKDFIHVHHIVPVSKMGEHYIVNPLTELIPVCPNCHAMLHKKDPPYSIDELKGQIIKNS